MEWEQMPSSPLLEPLCGVRWVTGLQDVLAERLHWVVFHTLWGDEISCFCTQTRNPSEQRTPLAQHVLLALAPSREPALGPPAQLGLSMCHFANGRAALVFRKAVL